MKQLLFVFLWTPTLASAQIFDEDEFEYNTEWIWGINKNTNGGLIGGIVVRYARSRGNNSYETYGLELSNVKHPSESRYIGASSAGFSYGKTNYLYSIRLQYGREKLLYGKANQQGVQISTGVGVGPSIGLETPYYVLKVDGGYVPFGPISTDTNPPTYPIPQSIAGPGRLFQGLGESKVVPGANFKAYVSFEFGTFNSNVAGIEVGVAGEIFSRVIEIVPTQPNNLAFSSFYFSLFWGTRK